LKNLPRRLFNLITESRESGNHSQLEKKEKNIIQSAAPLDPLKKTLSGKKKIVVVEDDPEMQNIFRLIFDKAGYEVDVIQDGKLVIKNDFKPPDIFLIDKLLSRCKSRGSLQASKSPKTNCKYSRYHDLGITQYWTRIEESRCR